MPDPAPLAAELEAPLYDPAAAAARTSEVARGVCGWAETQVVEELNAVLLAGNGSDSYIPPRRCPTPGRWRGCATTTATRWRSVRRRSSPTARCGSG